MRSFHQEVTNIFDDMQKDAHRGRRRSPYFTPGGMPRGRVYVSGWTPRIEHSDAGSRSTIRDTGIGLARSVSYRPAVAEDSDSSSYAAIRAHCLQTRSLWEDPEFPPVKQSLFYRRPPSPWPDIQWKRPGVSIYACLMVWFIGVQWHFQHKQGMSCHRSIKYIM